MKLRAYFHPLVGCITHGYDASRDSDTRRERERERHGSPDQMKSIPRARDEF